MVKKMKALADDELLQRAHAHELPALEAIYDRFNEGMYYYALRLLSDPLLAEDCVAETFRRFLQALKNGGGPQFNLKGYLYRSTHNWITDHYRKKFENPVELSFDLADPEAGPDDQVERNILCQRTRTALRYLTPEQRQVITLRFIEGWELAEIADTLNKPVGAVKSLQHRALASLQRILLPDRESVR